MRIVLIYDRLVRPDTTGVHCEKALRELGLNLVHYPPLRRNGAKLIFREWEDLPPADLYLQIDDDLSYPARQFDAVSAYWCIDVHRMDTMVGGTFTRWQKMRYFQHVFSAQRDMAQKLRIPWLPLAYDPAELYPIHECEKTYDWCFIGNFIGEDRAYAIEKLKASFPNAFVGQAYGGEMNRIYNRSRLAVNFSVGNDINMRFFEAQGTGTPLLTNRVNNGEDELFDGVLYFDSHDDMQPKMTCLLKAPAQLAQCAQQQVLRVSQLHTFRTRMRQLLALCGLAP